MQEGSPIDVSPEAYVQRLREKARKRIHLGLVDGALQAYREAIDLALQHGLAEGVMLLDEYNALLFQQWEALQKGVYRDARLHEYRVRSSSYVRRWGYWLGGFTGGQLVLLLVGMAFLARVGQALWVSLGRIPVLPNPSLGSFFLAFLLSAFRHPPVVTVLFAVGTLSGRGLDAMGGNGLNLLFAMLVACGGAWVVVWLAERWRLHPHRNRALHGMWVVGTTLLVEGVVDGFIHPGALERFGHPGLWLFNGVLGLTGWYVGYHVQRGIRAFRDTTR